MTAQSNQRKARMSWAKRILRILRLEGLEESRLDRRLEELRVEGDLQKNGCLKRVK